MVLAQKPRGKILRVQLGYNPNSSSLGVDVSFLLFGSLAVVALTSLASVLLRRGAARRDLGLEKSD
jgi:hypothetical protein